MAQPDIPAHTEDAAILAAVHAGQHQAFDRLVERHKTALLGYICHRVGDVHAAEDLLQELFLRVFRAALRGGFDGRSSVKTWLFTIANNCITVYRRASGRRRVVPVGDLAAEHDRPASHSDPAEAALIAEEHRRLHGVGRCCGRNEQNLALPCRGVCR